MLIQLREMSMEHRHSLLQAVDAVRTDFSYGNWRLPTAEGFGPGGAMFRILDELRTLAPEVGGALPPSASAGRVDSSKASPSPNI